MEWISVIALGTILAVPLAYGLATLLGMTHKQFRPIFHRNQSDGTTMPVIRDQAPPTIGQRVS